MYTSFLKLLSNVFTGIVYKINREIKRQETLQKNKVLDLVKSTMWTYEEALKIQKEHNDALVDNANEDNVNEDNVNEGNYFLVLAKQRYHTDYVNKDHWFFNINIPYYRENEEYHCLMSIPMKKENYKHLINIMEETPYYTRADFEKVYFKTHITNYNSVFEYIGTRYYNIDLLKILYKKLNIMPEIDHYCSNFDYVNERVKHCRMNILERPLDNTSDCAMMVKIIKEIDLICGRFYRGTIPVKYNDETNYYLLRIPILKNKEMLKTMIHGPIENVDLSKLVDSPLYHGHNLLYQCNLKYRLDHIEYEPDDIDPEFIKFIDKAIC